MPVTVSDASITSSPDRTATPNVLITGAAGALGREVVQLFAGQGARLALLDQDLDRLTASFGDAGSHPERLLLAADVTSSERMQGAVRQVIEGFQHIDVLVHIAGGFEMGEMTHALSRVSWDRTDDSGHPCQPERHALGRSRELGVVGCSGPCHRFSRFECK